MLNNEVLYRYAHLPLFYKLGSITSKFMVSIFDIGYSSPLGGGFLSPPTPRVEAQCLRLTAKLSVFIPKDVEPYADWNREVNNKDRCLALTGREPGKYIIYGGTLDRAVSFKR